jgi:hypothetical protein
MQKRTSRFLPAIFTTVVLLAGCDSGPGGPGPAPGVDPVVKPRPGKPGQTDFTSEDQNAGPAQGGPGRATGGANPGFGLPGAAPAGDSSKTSPTPTAPPAGRTGEVEEGDIYKVVGNRLYYLNTYKGFIVYDVTDPKSPARLSRLPVFGYPIEMFVEGDTIYALLRDSLYLTQANGKLEFARHNVSQLVTIDISDAAHPRVLKTLDIIGQLREGVSRKVENTIYVVSYWNRWYWWGWGYEQQDQNRQDQAFVYSFDVSDRTSPRKAGELKIFEGGAVNFYDKATGASFNRNFGGVSISATANALMVVENWWIGSSGGYMRGPYGCGYYNSDQQAVVSIVDISDPRGQIRVHTRFETAGSLGDQFKQTYVHDAQTNRGYYYGIFARQGWSSSSCMGEQFIQNTIEAWDVTDGANPKRVGRLDFGKPNETVRGSAFDTDRQVAYAITARNIDPLYAISIADPANPRVLSAVDGLAGDISVFRLIGDKKFLLAVGRDGSATCTGFDTTRATEGGNGIAVSIIDVQDLAKVRLVQRQCVAIQNAAWVSSQITWDLDQAHKMLGMHSDGEVNVITVPVSYYTRNQNKDWWWDHYETAVGIMSWDLRRYDPAKSNTQQTVIQNHGTFVHPDGEVRRSVLFTHATLKQRMMANLSDTHISLANIQDLAKPRLESVVEVAPYLNELFRFGSYIVEEVQPRSDSGWDASRSAVEFRVKPAGGELDGQAPVATFMVGQAQQAIKHGDKLVVFRYVPGTEAVKPALGVVPVPAMPPKSEAVVFDLSDPTKPRLAGRVDMPQESFPYYRFYCGAYWGGYWWDWYYGGGSSWADTEAGLVIARQTWNMLGTVSQWKLSFLDLRNAGAPRLSEQTLDMSKDSYVSALTVDTIDGRGFYLGYRTKVGEVKRDNGAVFYRWRDYAARWELEGSRWVQRSALNVPGQLIQTFRSADNERLLLTTDYVARWITDPSGKQGTWASWTRASLLREIDLGGRSAAELLDARTFENLALASLVADGQRLFVNGRRNVYGYFYGASGVGPGGVATDAPVSSPGTPAAPMMDLSDRLMAFDLSGKKLNLVYDQSTRMFNVQLMGVHQGRLFANLAGDGILIIDVSDAAKPAGLHFARTLGYATHIEFAGDDAYVGSGFFGTTHIDLRALPTVSID